ncbi:phosphatidylinositol N-acetylglucosaminyltransferase [Eremomyces bilateralis CBS 781.70]|uniref:Phosphatidylinositol N-acetylglucosaminyltransferase n=1 Tax=Eremomyces bilateralis CBS 781.70 TaxID=1392243 RepID=A0A6G1FVU1_9PEZI|nr:phosphatidylinositol N-acetylglucosaminyltransferase [Eremomyces bilateralis CBS 781.70]KAF1809893.1 phosphatidylinositol N-acetylglucosaminyltransferase [Eremomyces bilateralis CBS 781.70]
MTSLRQAYAHIRDPSHLTPPETSRSSGTTHRSPPTHPTGDDPSVSNPAPRSARKKRPTRRSAKPVWQKLLWVPQEFPDNYTDEATFLDHLQRNPQLRSYEFWPLAAESTVIVQHVCSVAIFACCFAGIYQERTSPFTIAYWGSGATILGWVFCEYWLGHDETRFDHGPEGENEDEREHDLPTNATNSPSAMLDEKQGSGSTNGTKGHEAVPISGVTLTMLSVPTQTRLTTIKSGILIYCTLLGLSPILKSLTKSTSSDSIWAMSCWLMIINVFFFDYSSEISAKFPASLSMNAAVMASTVLASRLTSTTDVFLLMLFSIEVFALFPIFRLDLRRTSWQAHLSLTVVLVGMAGSGLGVTVSGGRWKAGAIGAILGYIITSLAMGLCSWWLIGLQKYKNEIYGPWDPARPVIRRPWA